MNLKENEELIALKESIVEGMLDYMEDEEDDDFSVEYTREDVDACKRILENYIEMISQTKDRDSAMKIVESTVLELNKLNERAGEDLIETDQREDICEYMIKAAALLGYNEEDEDITEEWREW